MKNSDDWPKNVPIIKIKPEHADDRGTISDVLNEGPIHHVSLITFNKGAIRANHFHKKSNQYNYLLSGKIELLIRVDLDGQVYRSILTPGDLALIPPRVPHALVAIEDSELITLTSLPRIGDGYETDTFRLSTPLTDLVRNG